MSKSAILDIETLKYWLTNTAMTVSRPTTWYVGFYTSGDVEVDDVVNDTAYARQSITFADPSLDAADDITKALSNSAVTFSAVVLGSGGAYSLKGCTIYDALTGGNELYSGVFSVNKSIIGGEVLSFAAGDIIATED